MIKFKFCLIVFLLLAQIGLGQKVSQEIRPITWQDIPNWRSISQNSFQMSSNGKWMVYAMMPVEGDGEVIVQKNEDPQTKKSFPIGSTTFPSISFSENGRWLAFKQYPKESEKKANSKNGGKGLKEKVILLDLDNDFKQTVFENVNSFSFNGENSTLLGLNLGNGGASGDAKGSDFLLVHLDSDKKRNIGNVLEFAFNKTGDYLAYSIDAANQSGNGVYLLELESGKTEILDSDTATYKSINWTEKGEAFALLKLVKDKSFKQDHGKLLAVKNLSDPQLIIYDPKKDSINFPKDYTISPNRKPMWSEDLTRLFYGIHPLVPEKKQSKIATQHTQKTINKDSLEQVNLEKIKSDSTIKSLADLQKAIAKIDSTKPKASPEKKDKTKPDMTIWHWQDSRLQSRQQILENQDKNYSLWSMYDSRTGKHTTLQDSTMRELTILTKEKFGLGVDLQEYELDINLDGQNYRDIYSVNLQTGERKLLFKKFYLPSFSSFPRISTDGNKLLYAKDGHFYIYNLVSGIEKNLTENINTSFVNLEDDHNVEKPMISPLGWSSDSKFVLLRDGWDIWQVPVDDKGKPINLTQNGRTEKIRYQSRFTLDPDEKGIDLSKPIFIRMYGEFSKKSGISKISPGKSGLLPGAKSLIWEDANINRLSKAKNAEVYYITKEKFNEPTEFYITNADLTDPKKVTENTPDASKFTWSSGVRLVDYISDKGDTLQAALFLPAGFVEGQKYPTIVYYYEKLSQILHNYSNPGFSWYRLEP
jgi:hypothetical protein